jgi:acyl transferase domain-containing protein/thioesterase domain-containing protein
MMKVAQAMRRELLPASLNFSKPNSRFDFPHSPFKVVSEAKPWPRNAIPRRASVNSLGVGGTNAHIVLEEAPARTRSAALGPHMLTLSAKTPAALDGLVAKWRTFLNAPSPDFSLADAAYTTQVGRKAFARRLAVVARDADELAAKLANGGDLKRLTGAAADATPRVVFMFPGGGAQYPNAARKLYESNKTFRAAAEECFASMPASVAADQRSLMFEADDPEAARLALEQPMHSLLSVFTVEYAMAKLWASWGVEPAALIGHSAGEYVAAVVAGVMSLKDAIGVVSLRGEIFENAPAGGMLSVKDAEKKVRALAGDDLDIAVINAPDLTVVSGAQAPLAAFAERLDAEGIEHAPIRIRVAAHSRMLDDALPRFRAFLDTIKFSEPKLPFISNLSGQVAAFGEVTNADYWVRHLRHAVRFADGLRAALAAPNTIMLEVGPGQSLGALASLADGAYDPLAVIASTPLPKEALDDEIFAHEALGRLWALGVAIDFARVRAPGQYNRVSLPTYAFDRKRHWIEPGHGQAAAQPETPAIVRRADIKDWFEERVWAPAPLAAAAANTGAHVVFGDESALSREVATRLKARGARCILVSKGDAFAAAGDDQFTLNPATLSDFGALIDALSERKIKPDAIVYLWPLRDKGEAAFDSAFNLAKAMQLQGWDDGVRVLAVIESALPAGAAPRHPMQAAVIGPLRTLGAESPGISAHVLDLDDVGEAAPARVLAELDSWGDQAIVAWRGDERLVETLKPETETQPRFAPRDNGVYLITGGIGGIGLQLARYLASAAHARLALVGRGAVPPREEWARLAEGWGASADVARARVWLGLESLGAEVLPISADVTDADGMRGALAAVRERFGVLNGVFHGAGAIDDAPIAAKALADAHKVLAPKIEGARILNDLIPDGSVDVFAVFSSTSVLLEAPGQSDYVAANRVLDAIAGARGDGLSIAWGMWADVGMAKRVVDAAASGPADPRAHPLLGVRTDGDDGVIRFHATYSADKLWVLAEHRIGAIAVLPGTAYVEIASAAALRAGLGDSVEVRKLNFLSPLVLREGRSRQARVTLMPLAEEGYRIEVESRANIAEEWLLHFEAQIGSLAEAAQPLGDLRADAAVETRRLSLEDRGVDFGPRWRNVRAAARGARTASGEFVLPETFANDLRTYRAHPALLDTAAATGLFLIETEGKSGVYAPISMQSVRLFKALPATLSTRARVISEHDHVDAAFDVDLRDCSGAIVAEIRGATYRRVAFDAKTADFAAPLRADSSLAERLLAAGIRAEESGAVMARLFASGARAVVVSPVEVAIARAASGAPAVKPHAGAKTALADADWANDTEKRLAEMCADILGVEAMGPNDEFLSYGGGSLTGVRLFARVRRELGADLSLSALLQAPTIRELAVLVRANSPQPVDQEQPKPARETAAEAPAAKPAPSSNVAQLPRRSKWTPLVRMAPGDPSVRPIFLIHGAPGNILWFMPLADRLRDAGPPLYGVEAQGVDGSLPFLDTIEEMAQLYVRHLLAIDPTGPYRLVGYSGGGVIAVEMAHILERSGRTVELLVMLDTLAPRAAVPLSFFDKLRLVGRMNPTYLLRYPRKFWRQLSAAVKARLTPAAVVRSKSQIEIRGDICKAAYLRAQSRYNPQPYSGDVLLFRAAIAEAIFSNAGDMLGWDDVLIGKVDIVLLEAEHGTLLVENALKVLASELRRRIRQLDEARPPIREAQ